MCLSSDMEIKANSSLKESTRLGIKNVGLIWLGDTHLVVIKSWHRDIVYITIYHQLLNPVGGCQLITPVGSRFLRYVLMMARFYLTVKSQLIKCKLL